MTNSTKRGRSFSSALQVLGSKQKTLKGAPAYSRLVNRPIGRIFAAASFALGLTPNQVTALSAVCTFIAIGVIALVPTTTLIAAMVALLLIIGYALDSADGQLARLRGGGSPAGEWLDHVVDAIKIATLHSAVLIAWFRFEDVRSAQLLVPVTFQAVASVMFFVIILNDQLRRSRRNTSEMILQGEGKSSILYTFAVVPTDYGLLCLIFFFFAWSGFVWMYSALLLANIAFLLLALPKWFIEVRRLS